jgi:uncharacterized membrane protein
MGSEFHLYKYIHTYIHVYINIYTRIHIFMYTYIYVYTCLYIILIIGGRLIANKYREGKMDRVKGRLMLHLVRVRSCKVQG